jgi:CDP-paratose 2-epimerase
MREHFFGREASTEWSIRDLLKLKNYEHYSLDIRNFEPIDDLLKKLGTTVELIVHAAGQPSHDWAAKEPLIDFTINAAGTLNLLEATRRHAPRAIFVFLSSNKVYGDAVNSLPLVELATRWELDPHHPFYERGVDESASIDQTQHSIFGASKTAADIMVQEYGRYFGIRSACFRAGCLSGGGHSGAPEHGFLSYLMKCTLLGRPYTVWGHKAKQVRDNIHASDVVAAIYEFWQNPKVARVYNIGGGRSVNCSMVEAIELCQSLCKRDLHWEYADQCRVGDHRWWITDSSLFQTDFPNFSLSYDLAGILADIYDRGKRRWSAAK